MHVKYRSAHVPKWKILIDHVVTFFLWKISLFSVRCQVININVIDSLYDMMHKILAYIGILSGCYWNVKNIFHNLTCMFNMHVCLTCISNLNKHVLNQIHFWKINSSIFRPESNGILKLPSNQGHHSNCWKL
jgi:hypothetical protein